MSILTPLETCLARALDGLTPVQPDMLAPEAALGHVLAQDVICPQDSPARHEALRAGFAVAALDIVGANPGAPIPLPAPAQVLPKDALPPATDAVLPEDGTETWAGLLQAIRPISPGEGVRRAGHDARVGAILAPAGSRLTSAQMLAAALGGAAHVATRRPRVALALDDPAQTAFARGWLATLGAICVTATPDLVLRGTSEHAPRLAFAPAETAWLVRDTGPLVLDLPRRFDGMVTACLGLALPALAQLSGATLRSKTRPIARKLTSTVGLSELALLGRADGQWHPQPAGTLTLTGLATAHAFAILPPNSEGLAAGSRLCATLLDTPFE